MMMPTGKINNTGIYFFLERETVQENTTSAKGTRMAESGDFGVDVTGTSALMSGGTSVLSSA
jgi:hypothetical protein